LGTLLVNVAGCLLIGYVAASFAGERQAAFSLLMNRPLVVTGFLGALTTFSTFGFEVVDLALRRGPAWAAALVALHVVLGLAAVVGGMRLGE
jgi:CrcB protein